MYGPRLKLAASLGRRQALSVLGGAVLTGVAGLFRNPADAALAAGPGQAWGTGLRIRGADISFTLQEEAIGTALRDAGGILPIEQVLARRGANTVRLRLWVNPVAGTSGLEQTMAMARRAHQAGLSLLLDLHYSDTWADGQSQWSPKTWEGLDKGALRSAVENYTRDVVGALARQGTPVDIVQIGNEISRGMLWPAGQIYRSDGEHWSEFSELLKAGARGAGDGNPGRPPLLMLHSETGGDVEASKYFFDNIVDLGVPFDMIGLSYYPFWHGPLSALETNVHQLSTRYDKDVLVAETAYPWSLANGDKEPNVVGNVSELPEAAIYPPTPEGQAAYFEGLRHMLLQVPDGRGAGFLVWEPGWLPGVPATPEMGNAHDNLTLFDGSGAGLPALKAFRP